MKLGLNRSIWLIDSTIFQCKSNWLYNFKFTALVVLELSVIIKNIKTKQLY